VDAVVVRRDQAFRRHERGAAAARRDDGTHGEAGQVGKLVRVDLQPELLELFTEGGDLLRCPHAVVGECGQSEGGQHEKTKECSEKLHGFSYDMPPEDRWRSFGGDAALRYAKQ
jgi:hypothetical protein